ncbi:Wzz/FepE/Etk N-terminal domain-containing protein [Butyrivibrio sp. MB2005]|uniref:Wzz/FepE/Etk N-terminal domain-containing protein n=1 Tax=Butyrivibrio sp. MB2005 TaxID=1280678 RepID=UPI0004020A79|nr:Wzz/FepE/Etk N-terminal domain-containing protein [Butyrivibrio sp. MB2005]
MNKEIRIDIAKIFNSILQKWWIIVCSMAAFLAAANVYAEATVVKTYEATTIVFSMAYESLSDSLTGASALSAYADLATSRKVAEIALTYLSGEYEYDANDIKSMISTSTTATNSSRLSEKIYITAKAESPEHAVAIANAVANAFVIEMQSMTGGNTVQVLDSAQKGYISNGNEKNLIRVIGAFIGMIIPIMIIFFKGILTDEVYRIEDAACDGELEILAVIPDFDNK